MLGNPLLHMGLGILSQSGPSPYPQGLAPIGRGGLLGMQSFQDQQLAAERQKLMQARLEEIQRQQEQASAEQAAINAIVGTAPTPGVPGRSALDHPGRAAMAAVPGTPGTGLRGGQSIEELLPSMLQTQSLRGPAIQGMLSGLAPGKRQIVKDVAGRPRYPDTGELVYPNVETPPPTDKGFGGSLHGTALNELETAQKEFDETGRLSPGTLRRAQSAESILERPMVRQGPDGALYEIPPIGVPPAYQHLISGAKTSPLTDGRRDTPRQILEGTSTVEKRRRIDSAVNDITSIASMLNEAEKAGKVITGVSGAFKRKAYPLARGTLEAFGMEAPGALSPEAEILRGKLEGLKFQLAPLILEQKGKGLSDKDAERMDRILGGEFADTQQLRAELGWMLDKLEQIQGVYK